MELEREYDYDDEFVKNLGIENFPDEIKQELFERYDGQALDEDFVKICDKGDYKSAYNDFIKFEMGFDEEFRNICSFDEFVKQIQKGYRQSDYTQISRLIETNQGIFYDNLFI